MQPSRIAVVVCLTTFAACGGGGGGGTPGPSAPEPLVTDTITSDPADITYRVSGQVTSNVSGTQAVSGTATISGCASLTIGGTLCACRQTYEDLGALGTSLSKSFTFRDLPTNTIRLAGETLSDGTTIEWIPVPASGPLTYSVGESWAGAGTAVGFLLNTSVVRMAQTASSWQVSGIDDIQVPAGWYECYVLGNSRTTYDYLTGIERVSTGTSYVRPDFGVVYSTITLTATDGVEIITLTLTIEATSIS